MTDIAPPDRPAEPGHRTADVGDLRARLTAVSVADRLRLERQLVKSRRISPARKRHERLRAIEDDIASAAARRAARAATVPPVSHPPELPISERAEELVEALRTHQVIVVAGETGSGKSTQLPKLCLAAGRGVAGMIGHTQPRRIAARAVAERVAQELQTDVGDLVGYTVRFTDRASEKTLIKVMTDGILLNEIQQDRLLTRYDTIIIDEAHERGLNIDFILGYLRQLLPKRPDLTVVITSATIDTERFADHFAVDGVPAPIIEVSGRTYPVELRYRPLADAEGRELDLVDGIVDAAAELAAEGPGDILVFASGERDIRDAAEALMRARQHAGPLKGVDVLPLYARLSAEEQHRVFAAHSGRRIVIATNIAETSLTVPGIRYVIDPGLARISRYSRRTKVQRLPIEKVSQASANQRSGRCGRLGPGIAIRLFDEDDFQSRSAFTEPEILRTNLAAVILQMTAIGLGDVSAFPFVDPPDSRQIADGVTLLEELQAIRADASQPGGRGLTDVGKGLSRLPIDPRLGRMVIAAAEEGCVHEVMVIAAGLSIQDPRERPRDKAHSAERYHQVYVEEGSDFLTLLNLWSHLRDAQRRLSGNQFRKRCKQEFLHYLRVREWQDVYSQLRRAVRSVGIEVSRADHGTMDANAHDRIHRAMLAGLLSNIGLRDGDRREYLGTRGTRFVLGSRSVLAEARPGWVVAAELVETHRLFASMAAGIRPQWIEPLAGDLVVRTHGEASWDARVGAALTTEKVSFRGVPIVSGRRISLGSVDPAGARAMFIDRALLGGDWSGTYRFLDHNRARVAEVHKLEARLRRPGLMAPEDVLREVYEERIPTLVTGGASFDQWWRATLQTDPHQLDVDVASLLAGGQDELAALEGFPDHWSGPSGGSAADLQLHYRFTPEDPDADGVTVDIPLAALPGVDAGALEWQVPGLRQELVVALIRALPKSLRRALVPAPDAAQRALRMVGPQDGPFLPTLARALSQIGGVPITPQAWAGAAIPPHLRLRYRIVEDGTVLAAGTDLAGIKRGVDSHLRRAVRAAAPVPAATGLTRWSIGDLPQQIQSTSGEISVIAYPALVDEQVSVGVAGFTSPVEQQRAMHSGTRRLLQLQLPSPLKAVAAQLDTRERLSLTLAPHADVAAVIADCRQCVLDAIITDAGGPAWTADGFAALLERGRADQDRLVVVTARATAHIVGLAQQVREALRQPIPRSLHDARTDIAQQLGRMIYPGFVSGTGGARLGHLPRYLQGMRIRLDTMGRNPERDADHMALIRDLDAERRQQVELPGRTVDQSHAAHARWLIEEMRVSLFAQALGTPERVSEARVRKAIKALSTTATHAG